MKKNVTQKLIDAHLIENQGTGSDEIGLRIDQTLTQDATGTLVMLEFEAMGLPRVKTELSAQYVDHNLVQSDFKNADDHLFLRSACARYGIYYSRPGNGVSHPVHMENFGIPGKSLLGSDSHTCAAGSLGMLAIGAGGLEIAMAMAGKPFYVKKPKIFGVKLTGKLPDWVSAKDVILEMLRRYNVDGGVGKIIEYYGPGLDHLSAMDRHVIANMGAELGATTSVFPSDNMVRTFLKSQGRESDWVELLADEGAEYDQHDEINLSGLQPLIALPSSPGNVVPVSEVSGHEIYQAMIGSSANPGIRDFAIAALIADGGQVHDRVSLDINPTSRQIVENLIEMKLLAKLFRAGGRIHQAGCNGCIGMGQAPATGRISLRTVPRNFPGRSGTKEDAVYLCSPETAIASALKGVITDPRTLDMPYPSFQEPDDIIINRDMITAPPVDGKGVALEKGPNVKSLPNFTTLPENLKCPVMLKIGDNVSTDEILPAGSKVLLFRSNIPEISKFVFGQVDADYSQRALRHKDCGSVIIGGKNYGQGSSREHAALAPRYLGVKAVIVKSFARIHFQNLANFGILPLEFEDPADWEAIEQGHELAFQNIRNAIQDDTSVTVRNLSTGAIIKTRHRLTKRQIDMILEGSLINLVKAEIGGTPAP